MNDVDQQQLDLVRQQIGQRVVSSPSELYQLVDSTLPLATSREREAVAAVVASTLFGLGVLQPLMVDDDITDICINGPGNVWVERGGALHKLDLCVTAQELWSIVERLAALGDQHIDRLSPLVDVRLPGGARAHVSLPPVALDGPYVAIRKFAPRRLGLSEFCDLVMLDELVRLVTNRHNIVVCGGTGAGKTTLLGALAEWFDPGDRVATIEDTAELDLRHPHVLRLESRTANTEGIGGISMRDLVRASLRLRPDRLVVGEVRGAEAYDMLQALNTGHGGSLTTVHANDGVAALTRLQTLCMLADSSITGEIARHMVLSAVGAVVVVRRLPDGKRVVDQLYDIANQQLWLRQQHNVAQYTVEQMLAEDSPHGWEEPQ